MKKAIALIVIMNSFVISTFAQNISKEVPEKEKLEYFYLRERYILGNKKILSIYDLKKENVIRLDLLDENFNEIISKKIPKYEDADYYIFHVEGNFLYMINDFKKPKKNPGIKISMIALDETFTTKKYSLTKATSIVTDVSNKFCYYKEEGTSKLIKYNLDTKEKIIINLRNSSDEKVYFYNINSFQNTSNIVLSDYNGSKEKDAYSISLFDNDGREKFSFNRFENNNYKSTVFYANNDSEIITSGNFIRDPKIDEIVNRTSTQIKSQQPKYDGIYLRTLNSEKIIEKYYEYDKFPKLYEAINSDKKDVRLIDKLSYIVEDIIKVGEEYISIGTINENKYQYSDSPGGHLVSEFIGTSLKYILIYGFNSDGEITWEQILSPDWNYTRYKHDRIFDVAEAGNLITIKKIDDKITCHFSLINKIHYFEIVDKEISNYKQTEYEFKIGSNRLKDKGAKDIDQYKHSFYWYDNFYCSYLRGFTDKHTLFNRTEFKK